MQVKNYKSKSVQSTQIKIAASSSSGVDFNSKAIKEQLIEVKKKGKAVLDGANIDPLRLSLNFTI
jgi:hypothetical protein